MKRLLACSLLSACAVVACTLDVTDFAGKTCETSSDCPSDYVCVAARVGAGRTCEVLGLPAVTDAGDQDAGPVPTYCADVEPILAASCVSTCHGAVRTGSRNDSFRLDYYAPEDGGLPGAQSQAARIKARAFDFQDMPPLDGGVPIPTPAQRTVLARWAQGGAPFCDDAGIVVGDGGTDAGPDGGG